MRGKCAVIVTAINLAKLRMNLTYTLVLAARS